MVVGVLRIELILYSPQNLKEKRGVIRKILDRCRGRFPVSCAETGLQDLWQRSEMGFAVVHGEEAPIQAIFARVEEEIARTGVAEVSARQTEFLHF